MSCSNLVSRKGHEENSAKVAKENLLSLRDFIALPFSLRSLREKYSSATFLKKSEMPHALFN
jgi:hypothetical protein